MGASRPLAKEFQAGCGRWSLWMSKCCLRGWIGSQLSKGDRDSAQLTRYCWTPDHV